MIKKQRANLGVPRNLAALAATLEMLHEHLSVSCVDVDRRAALVFAEGVLARFPWASVDSFVRSMRRREIFYATWDLSRFLDDSTSEWLRHRRREKRALPISTHEIVDLLAAQLRPTQVQDRLFEIAQMVANIRRAVPMLAGGTRATPHSLREEGAIVRRLIKLICAEGTAELLLEPTDNGYGPVVAARAVLAQATDLSPSTIKAAARRFIEESGGSPDRRVHAPRAPRR